jgi:hypothetical protein
VATPQYEPAKGQDDNERAMVTPKNTELDSNPKASRAEVSSDHDIGVAGLTVDPRNSKGVGRREICGLLIERHQDVSIHSVA